MPAFVTRRAPGAPALSSSRVRKMAEQMLDYLGVSGSELSILLCGDAGIRKLNREHRDKDKPTDVLSFPQAEFRQPEKPARGHTLHLLGDVVISLETAERQAQGRKRPLEDEVRFLLAHGILHLLGHDHMTADEKKVMSRRTRELVKAAPHSSDL